MSDLVAALVTALTAPGPYAVVTGRRWPGLDALVESAQTHVVIPAAATRLAVGTGLGLGGRRAVAVLDAPPDEAPRDGQVAVTTSTDCAMGALARGWTVAQPALSGDVAALSRRAGLLLLGPVHSDVVAPDDTPPLQRTRTWHRGPMATLVASGASTVPMRRLAERLSSRGIEVTAIELPLLDRPAHAPFAGRAVLGVAGAGAAGVLRQGGWTDGIALLDIGGSDEAELVGAVLARVPAAPTV